MLVLRNYEFLIHFEGTFQSSSGEYLVPICYALVDCLQYPAWPFPAGMSHHTLGAAMCQSLASACKAQLRNLQANWYALHSHHSLAEWCKFRPKSRSPRY